MIIKRFGPIALGVQPNRAGDRYEGTWKDNKFNGRGVYYFKDGDRYEREFINGNFHGYGKYFYQNGSMYDGNWIKGKKSGLGKFIYADGEAYEGQFVNDLFHGLGRVILTTGGKIDGEWSNDEKHGVQIECDKNGILHGSEVYKNGKVVRRLDYLEAEKERARLQAELLKIFAENRKSEPEQQKITAVLKRFECGDSCYVVVVNNAGREESFLCSAPICERWVDSGYLPVELRNQRVGITLSQKNLYTSSGKIAGTDLSAEKIEFISGIVNSPSSITNK